VKLAATVSLDDGLVCKVTVAVAAVKLPVTVAVPVIVQFCGFVVPLRAPLKPENW
jgi:hypothetical protein